MAPEELEGPEAEEVPVAPEAPSMDPRTAMEIAAQQFGVSPDFLEGAVRLQDENRRVAEENRRRAREIEIREAQVEALGRDRQQFAPSRTNNYEEMDPSVRRLHERFDAWDAREERKEQAARSAEEHARRVENDMHTMRRGFHDIMRGVPTQNKMEEGRFFEAMAELYPTSTGALPDGVTTERAIYNTARFLGLNPSGGGSGGYGQSRTTNGSTTPDRRASIVIPGGTTGGGPAIPASAGYDIGPQKPGETMEQALARQKSEFARATEGGMNMSNIPEGRKFSSD